ncbi:MAG: sulfatase-like hydrolase/transferase [Planctomycetes bacterium]|nr:sulfatase-like hydrolase/transferase [Planctomycetota bacterium]
MADDLGYECISANGCEDYKTPHLDKLAKEGMRFTNCYANPICTPSRVKIMTGQYNVRNYESFGSLPRSQKTFGQSFKKAGYRTAIAGKWQLGTESDSPQYFGFEESCLWQQSLPRAKKGLGADSRFENPILEYNGKVKEYKNGEFGPDLCTDFICNFIDDNKDQPFMVYYPMLFTHCPFIPTPGTPDYDPASPGSKSYKGDAKYFVNMVKHMDILIGRIRTKLEEVGLLDNTLIIFTGDNGTDKPVKTMMNGKEIPGGKGSMNDNGYRVPLIARLPGKVKANIVSPELVDFSDFFPTICEAAGIERPANAIDGVSLWPTFTGEGSRDKPYAYIWYNRNNQMGKGTVVARTANYIVKRNDGKASKLYYSPEAFEVEERNMESLSEKEDTIYKKLNQVILDYDKTRPEGMTKPPKEKKNKKKGRNKSKG